MYCKQSYWFTSCHLLKVIHWLCMGEITSNQLDHWVFLTVYLSCICHVNWKADSCPSALLMLTYLQALVSVAQAQLPAGHHGLLGAPALSTDQTPALRPVRVWAQHLHAALVTGPSSSESDLCEAERVRDYKAECGCTRETRDKKLYLLCFSLVKNLQS